MNAAAALLAAGDPAHTALVCGERSVSYAQLAEVVSRVADGLRARGIKPGEPVLLAADDGIDWVAAHLGTIWAGAVSVPLNPQLAAQRLAQIARESAARLMISDRPHATGIEVCTPAQLSGGESMAAHPVCADTPALWVHSSGTTSQPKAVVHAHRAIAGCAAFARDVLQAGPQDRFYASSKLFFAYPLANSLYAGLALGACVILDPRWPEAAAAIATVKAQNATILWSVPSFYYAMLQSGRAGSLRDSSLLHCVSAGESLPERIADDWHDATGVGVFGGYGMSETLALVLYREVRREAHARLAPLAQLSAHRAAAPGAPCRLWFKHPSVALGYNRRPDLEQASFRDGWCSAGDLFYQPLPDRYRFAGRSDDWAKVSGRWVSVLELESQLTQQCRGDIRELAAAAVTGPEGLSAIALFAVAGKNGAAASQALLERAGARLPTYQRPRWLHWVEALPRTDSGKLARAALQALHRQCLEQQ